MREHRCCFTGHRPGKISLNEREMKRLLETAIDAAIAQGYVTFISGMAQGTDIYAAEIILEKRRTNNNLHLICALPHPDFDSRRSLYEKLRFERIIRKADFVKEVNDHYFTGCYQVRNKWMVDHSSLVIAVFNGQKGGTKNTIDYAVQKGIRIINVLEH